MNKSVRKWAIIGNGPLTTIMPFTQLISRSTNEFKLKSPGVDLKTSKLPFSKIIDCVLPSTPKCTSKFEPDPSGLPEKVKIAEFGTRMLTFTLSRRIELKTRSKPMVLKAKYMF